MLKMKQYGTVTRIDSARTLAGKGYYWANAYLVDGLLIDSGCAHSAHELLETIENGEIRSILNTHSHEDHIGANGILQERWPEIEIMAHPSAIPVLANPHEKQPLQLYRRVFWGWPKPSVGRMVEDGALIETENYRFQVIYTPGHNPDHICLYEENQGWLFSGDLFVGGKDRAIRVEYDIWQIIESLKKIAVLPLTRLFPGCARVRDHPHDALKDKINYLEETGEKILALHQSGMGTKAIARRLFGRSMLIEYLTMGHFTRRGLVKSYLQQAVQDR